MSKPNEAQLQKLMSLPKEASVAALNLFKFNDQAQYQPEDPEFGTGLSGQEAYSKYAAEAGPYIEKLGGRVVFSTAIAQTMIGSEAFEWDVAAIMYFPTRGAFITMLSDPQFQHSSRHRKAALADHFMLHLAGEPFDEL